MFVGIDLGTSSVKTILIDENQKTLSTHTENIELLNPQIGFYEQDPETWYEATLKCFLKIKQDKPKEFYSVRSIGISGQMHGATVLDRNNNILHPCILWNDTRSMKQCVEMEKNYPQLQEESGNIAMPGFTAPKILWLKENKKEVFDKIYKILLPKDYLRFKLSGSYFSDMSDASGTLWLNVRQRKWSDSLLNLTDLTIENMPELVEGTAPTPCVENKLAKEIGFDNKVIIAGGAGDQAAGAAGSGVVYPSQSVISLGTSGVYFSPIENFSSNTDEAVHSFCHCVPNTWHHMSVMLSATNCLDWICTITSLDIGTALKLAEEFCSNDLTENNAPYFLPYLSGERTPHNSADIRAAFHQINTSTSKAAILYSVLEGVTFGIKDGFKAVEAINKNTDETYIVGGGSRSDFWTNLVGSAINKSIIIGEDSNLGPSLGAARLAMMATKNFAGKDVFKKMPIRKEINIDKKLSEILNKRYAVWSEIVSTNLTIAGKLKIIKN